MRLDKRTREDIMRQMAELAGSYAPEWNFQENHGDAGSALMNIYADMLMEMIRRYNQAPERDRQVFFQKLGTRQRPAIPARGYVSFAMVNKESDGGNLPAGTGLYGNANDKERIKMEIQKDIYVNGSEIKKVFYQDGNRDEIFHMANQEGILAGSDIENCQEHVCWLGHGTVLDVGAEAEIFISFLPGTGRQDWNLLIQDKEKTEFSYLSKQGEQRFEEWSCENHVVRLKKTREMPDFSPAEVRDGKYCCVKWKAKDIHSYREFAINEIRIGSAAGACVPEYIYTADGQEAHKRCYPFGERPYSSGECYICSNEVLAKKGAFIEMEMAIEFRRICPLAEQAAPPIHWKKIMQQSDFPKPEALPITVGQVVWEYYNGTGFTRLFYEELHGELFSPGEDEAKNPGAIVSKKVTVSFHCPDDIQPFLVNAGMAYCIRARVLWIRNEYAVYGYYVTPFIVDTKLSYSYRNAMQIPSLCKLCNNLDERFTDAGHALAPFQGLEESRPALYIGFDQPLHGGPFGLYCGRKGDVLPGNRRKWNYEYYNGKEWKSLVLEDNTENLTKSGTLMLFGNDGFSDTDLFGSRLFWLRFVLVQGDLDEGGAASRIPIDELWFHTVSVAAVETVQEEFFTVSETDGYPEFSLKHNNIQKVEVWVNECYLSQREQEQLEKETEVHRIRNEEGEISEVWVLWQEAGDVLQPGQERRYYRMERREGILQFPYGVPGCLGGSSGESQVKVTYSWGGGSKGNLEEGQVTGMSRSVRFLRRVVNHQKFSGGRDAELPEKAVERMEHQLLHRNRAVMISDYEALALEATGEAARVKAFSNRNGEGECQRGAITLVILQEDDAADFKALQETIYGYVLRRMPALRLLQNHLYLVRPWLTSVQVSADCIIKARYSVFSCKAEAEERLCSFLHPLSGNFDGRGWDIGQAPRLEQLRNVLQNIRGIERIKKMTVKAFCHRNGRIQEIDLEGRLPEFLVVMNGTHNLRFAFETGGIMEGNGK